MSATATLSHQGEEDWLRFRHHVEWPSGFALIFLFSSNATVHNLFYERLASIYRTRVSQVQRIAPSAPDTFPEEVLTLIRSRSELLEQARAPLWIDLSQGMDEAWHKARDNLIARLNEHRELLRSRFPRAVIILLPRKRLGDTPETVRDLSISLNNVGALARFNSLL